MRDQWTRRDDRPASSWAATGHRRLVWASLLRAGVSMKDLSYWWGFVLLISMLMSSA